MAYDDATLSQASTERAACRASYSDADAERDYAEEAYWRAFCPACGVSPCTWDGRPDGFHTEEGS